MSSCIPVSMSITVVPCPTIMASPSVKLSGKEYRSQGVSRLYTTTLASKGQKRTLEEEGGGGGNKGYQNP